MVFLLACIGFPTKETNPPIVLNPSTEETDGIGDSGIEIEEIGLPQEDTAYEYCALTPPSPQDVHYRENPPIRNNLHLYEESNPLITIRGLIQNTACERKSNLRIQAWHADSNGQYDISSEEYKYYGEFISNGEGFFEFFTILPGVEQVASNQYKPAQIHIKVLNSDEEMLNTTIYFRDDPFLAFDEDIPDESIVDLVLDGNIYVGVFPLVF